MRADRLTAAGLVLVAMVPCVVGGRPRGKPAPATQPTTRPTTRAAAFPATRPATGPAIRPAAVPRVSADRAGDVLSARVDGRAAVVDVWSPRGIGSGKVVLPAANAPETLRLRLHLRGLEGLRISDGAVTVEVSVASHSGHLVRADLRRPGQRRPMDLKPDNPLHPAARLAGPGGKPVRKFPIPEGGHIEIALPGALLKEFGPSLQIRWIDFYR